MPESDLMVYDGQEPLDDVVWDRNDDESDQGLKLIRLKTTCRKAEELAARLFNREASLVSPIILGGFNVLYRIHLKGRSPDALVRLPCPSPVQFPVEKTAQEAATAKLVAKKTDAPIPLHLFDGEDPDLGPYAIMDYVENSGSVSARLTIPNKDICEPHVLDPYVAEDTLASIWGKIAAQQLKRSHLRFPRIGSLLETAEGIFEVAGRPISHNMTDMVRLTNVPRAVLPPEGQTYQTSDDWYTALAEMHIAQLAFQHNDAVASEDDCRNKYVARMVFRRLAKQGRLSTFGFKEDDWSIQSSRLGDSVTCPAPSNSESFHLWGDDFRAGNILLDAEDNIAALIDWEYTYAAPTQFVLDPPWWLLIETIEMWSHGPDTWCGIYEDRLPSWFSAMEKAEAESDAPSPFPLPLSVYMRESWKTGRFF